MKARRPGSGDAPGPPSKSAFAGYRFPAEVITDAAAVYPAVLGELVPSAWHHVEQYANNPIEADHSQLKHRLRPMRGLRTDQTAQTVVAGHAFIQNLRRGHYELGLDARPAKRVGPVPPSGVTAASRRWAQGNLRVACRSAADQRKGVQLIFACHPRGMR
jgi:DDE domain